MGFHYEEESIIDGSIDNRIKGKTVIKINFASHTSSLVTLQGNPCRDLAGSLWSFKNPHAQMDELPGEQCFFIPALCEGSVGHISYSRKTEVPVLPIEEHMDLLFGGGESEPPMKVAPVLELEWFTPKFGQVEIDCQQMMLELVEMSWSLTEEEAVEGENLVKQMRSEVVGRSGEDMEDFYDDMDLIEEYLEEDSEPHELEEQCFLIVQEFVINSADDSEQKQELHGNLLKLQEQIGGAFIHYNDEGEFDDVPHTVKLLTKVLPLIDRASTSAKYVAETTVEHLALLQEGIVVLRDELSRSMRQ